MQLICLASLLIDYDIWDHVPSDVGVDQKFLPLQPLPIQKILDSVWLWSEENLAKLNTNKCYYMVFSRSEENFSTRLVLNNNVLEQKSDAKLLGMWITEDLSWAKNCQEICKKAYSRLSLITKLKYVGVNTDDLIEIYILFIRSIVEYCSVVYHSSLTVEQTNKLEKIQKTCLKVILGDLYIDYPAALEMCGLETLESRRQERCLNFALKAVKHPKNRRLFPPNLVNTDHTVRRREKFAVNFARTDAYQRSAIPFCQKLLNQHAMKE